MPSKSFKDRNSFYLCRWLWFSRIKIKAMTVGRAMTNAEISLLNPSISATVRLVSRLAVGTHARFGKHGSAALASELEQEEWGIQIAEGREQSGSSGVELEKGSLEKNQQQQKHTQKETEADYCPSPGKASWEDASPQLLVCALWLMYTESLDNWGKVMPNSYQYRWAGFVFLQRFHVEMRLHLMRPSPCLK